MRLRIYDRGANAFVAERIETPSAAGDWLWYTTLTWKSTPDSYRVTAEHYLNGSWILDDSIIGSVAADSNSSNHSYWYWSPNQYTWGYPWNQTTNYVDYYQHFWYWNDTGYGSTRGSDRLYNLNHDPNAWTWTGYPAFQHEFRRVISVSNPNPAEGWDAKYVDSSGFIYLYGYYTNLPGGYSDTALVEETSFGDADEEAEIKTTATESMWAISGNDPTNTYARSDAYKSWFTFYRRYPQRGTTFLMQTEFELMHQPPIDLHFDIAAATKHTSTF